jgi:hypothetical protein
MPIARGFQSSYFDGMDDGYHGIEPTMVAEADGVIREHRYSCRGINWHRDYSPEAEAFAAAYVEAMGLEAFANAYGVPDAREAGWRVLHYLDLTGIEWDSLPEPGAEFTGRHVHEFYVVDDGRTYGEAEGAHRAEVAA